MESNWESRECFFPFFSFSLYLSLRFKIARAMDRNFEFARSFARTAANYNYSEFQCKKKKKKKSCREKRYADENFILSRSFLSNYYLSSR